MKHLRLVSAVAEERGLTAASRRLNLTPSAMSHQLRKVETMVGMPLFRRDRNAMSLTSAGEIVYELATRAIGAVNDVQDRLEHLRAGDGGMIRLCTHCYTGYHWLPQVVKGYQTEFPGVEIRVVAEATYRAIEALLSRELDLVISTMISNDDRLQSRVVMKDELFLVVPREHPLAKRRSIEPVHLAKENLLMYTETPDESSVCVDFLRPAGFWPRRFTSVLLTEAIIEMVKAGLGVACLAEWSIRPELERETLVAVRLGRGGFRRTWRAYTWRKPDPGPLVDGFVDHLVRSVKKTKLRSIEAIAS